MEIKIYQVKTGKLKGSDFREVHKKAREIYDEILKNSKRKPYIRSQYFKKDKIFLDYFWEHLFMKKNGKDRLRRIQFYASAVELMRSSPLEPESKENPNRKDELLHRFSGMTRQKEVFFVQIKEDKKSNKKYFISVFPA